MYNKVSEVPGQQPFFVDATNELKIDYVHKENEFDDFDREFLIPHELSNMGPGIAVADVNGDGLDDSLLVEPACLLVYCMCKHQWNLQQISGI